MNYNDLKLTYLSFSNESDVIQYISYHSEFYLFGAITG